MVKYATQRIIGIIPTVLILLFLVVLMVRLIPGDIIDVVLQEQVGDPAARAELEKELGLDRPLPVRYAQYVLNAARGDLGQSLWTNEPVTELIAERAFVTFEVGAIATVVGAVIGILLGAISAVKQDSWIDYLLRSVAIGGISIPSFAIATFVVIMPAVWWGVRVSQRYVGLTEDPVTHMKIVIVPAIVLGLNLSAGLMRLTRTTMLDVLRQDYVRTAYAKGLHGYRVIVGHALKNAIIPVVTVIGLQVAFLIGGTVITESVFVVPGMGRLLLNAIAQRDYPIIQGIVLVLGFFTLAINLIVDLSYGWIDPRIRYR